MHGAAGAICQGVLYACQARLVGCCHAGQLVTAQQMMSLLPQIMIGILLLEVSSQLFCLTPHFLVLQACGQSVHDDGTVEITNSHSRSKLLHFQPLRLPVRLPVCCCHCCYCLPAALWWTSTMFRTTSCSFCLTSPATRTSLPFCWTATACSTYVSTVASAILLATALLGVIQHINGKQMQFHNIHLC
jgi:hypothetical protein